MSTARDLISDAFRLIGAISSGETPTAAEARDGLRTLNRMLASWSTTKLLIPYESQEALAVSASPVSLATRPMRVIGGVIDVAGQSYDVAALTNDAYWAIADKTRTGRPEWVWWDSKNPLSQIFLYPVPDQAYALTLRRWDRLASIPNLDDTVVLPAEYDEAIAYNLAVRLAPEYGVSVSAEVAAVARDSFDSVKRQNGADIPAMTTDLVGTMQRRYYGGF